MMSSLPECLLFLRKKLETRSRITLDVPDGFMRAAVLIPLLRKNNRWTLIFTRRTELVSQHKNEISFPGGRSDPQDLSLVDTALREAFEEVGITEVEIIGNLDDIITISRYIVTPVVGWIKNAANFHKSINKPEINYILETPVDELTKYKNFSVKEVPYQNGFIFQVPFFDYKSEIIWGATGRILVNLLNQINDLPLNCRKEMLGKHKWEGIDNDEVEYYYTQVENLISEEKRKEENS